MFAAIIRNRKICHEFACGEILSLTHQNQGEDNDYELKICIKTYFIIFSPSSSVIIMIAWLIGLLASERMSKYVDLHFMNLF